MMSARVNVLMNHLSLSEQRPKVSKRPADQSKPVPPPKYRHIESQEKKEQLEAVVRKVLDYYQECKNIASGEKKPLESTAKMDEILSEDYQRRVLGNLFRAPHDARSAKVFKLRCEVLAVDGRYLEIASRTLKANSTAVKSAVSSYGLALAHASVELRRNPEIIQIAVQNNPKAAQYKL